MTCFEYYAKKEWSEIVELVERREFIRLKLGSYRRIQNAIARLTDLPHTTQVVGYRRP